ncbi:MAG: hypothetical protein B0W54_07915 [Cellvibrio sp. 79]|nr:MAG: hypothetical protein B0W54_07915 [Cellvibrio sp. 79]
MSVLNVFNNQEITFLFFLAMIVIIWIVMVGAYIQLVRQDNGNPYKRLQVEDNKLCRTDL